VSPNDIDFVPNTGLPNRSSIKRKRNGRFPSQNMLDPTTSGEIDEQFYIEFMGWKNLLNLFQFAIEHHVDIPDA